LQESVSGLVFSVMCYDYVTDVLGAAIVLLNNLWR